MKWNSKTTSGKGAGRLMAGAILLAIATSLLGCKDQETGQEFKDFVGYTESIQPIWDTKCDGGFCHNATHHAGGLAISKVPPLTSYGNLYNHIASKASATGTRLVDHEFPQLSVLLHRLDGINIPMNYPQSQWKMPKSETMNTKLSAQQRHDIEVWVTVLRGAAAPPSN